MIYQRVEIAPHYDLWMQGARYGSVLNIYRRKLDGVEIAVVKLDRWPKPVKVLAEDLKYI